MIVRSALLASALLSAGPAAAAVTYAFQGAILQGGLGILFQFNVVTPQYVTSFVQLAPATTSCQLQPAPPGVGCSVDGPISLQATTAPGFQADLLGFTGTINAVSRNYVIEFRTVGASVFSTPGTYQAFASPGLNQAVLTVSSSPDPAVPEPATWAMMLSGFCLLGRAVRAKRQAFPTTLSGKSLPNTRW